MMLPSYSICIPNYNHAAYLRRKIPQCLAQTAVPVEILIIDDGSTDDSVAVIEAFARDHPLIRLVRHPHNRGVNEAILTALQEARGEFVAISAADDFLAPDFAEHLLPILAEHPSTAFVFSDPAGHIQATGEQRAFPLHLSPNATYFSAAAFAHLIAHNYFTLPSHATLYRREALLAIGGFDPAMQWCGDWMASYAIAFLHGACYVPKILAHFTVREDSISSLGNRQSAAQKNLVRTMLTMLRSTPYDAVRAPFRYAALLPEHRLRALAVVARYDPSYLTLRLAWRCCWREGWFHVMRYLPLGLRRLLRRIVGCLNRR